MQCFPQCVLEFDELKISFKKPRSSVKPNYGVFSTSVIQMERETHSYLLLFVLTAVMRTWGILSLSWKVSSYFRQSMWFIMNTFLLFLSWVLSRDCLLFPYSFEEAALICGQRSTTCWGSRFVIIAYLIYSVQCKAPKRCPVFFSSLSHLNAIPHSNILMLTLQKQVAEILNIFFSFYLLHFHLTIMSPHSA